MVAHRLSSSIVVLGVCLASFVVAACSEGASQNDLGSRSRSESGKQDAPSNDSDENSPEQPQQHDDNAEKKADEVDPPASDPDASAPPQNVIDLKVDDDSDDPPFGSIDPFNTLKVGDVFRVEVTADPVCSTWKVEGATAFGAPTITDGPRGNGALAKFPKYFVWTASKAGLYSIRLTSGPAISGRPSCSFSTNVDVE